ncbi:MAG TPA: DUF3072 domain-containing protein [Segetibacter sp.]|jgi:hypothetical protein
MDNQHDSGEKDLDARNPHDGGSANTEKTSNTVKDPDEWTTGDEPMTGAQRSYLQTLLGEYGEALNENLTKAQAAKLINERQQSGGSQQGNAGSNTVKDPNDWKTGDQPMTGAQRSYLKTLSDEAGEQLDENLSKADASKRIDELQQRTGRGENNNNNNNNNNQ